MRRRCTERVQPETCVRPAEARETGLNRLWSNDFAPHDTAGPGHAMRTTAALGGAERTSVTNGHGRT